MLEECLLRVRQEAVAKPREASQRSCATQRTSSLLDSYAGMAPKALDSLTPDGRHEVYRMLRLEVLAHPDKALDVSGVLEAHTTVCGGETKRCIVL